MLNAEVNLMYVAGASSSYRVTGMVSGMDIDETVSNLMTAEMAEYNSVYQDKVKTGWEMDAYRDVTTEITGFKDTYFNYSQADTNMLAQSTYMQYDCESSSSAVSVSASASSSSQSHTMEVLQLASSAQCMGSESVSYPITASNSYDFDQAQDLELEMTLDGTTRTLTIDSSINSIETLQDAIDTLFGSGKITVNDDSGTLQFDTVSDSGSHALSIDGTDDLKTALGFSSDDSCSNRIETSASLESISTNLSTPFTFDTNNQIKLTINSVDFTFDETDTLDDIIEEINSSEANVVFAYDALNDQFSLTAGETGAGETLSISETSGQFLSSLGLDTVTQGQDAVIIIDDEQMTRSSNSISMDGVTYKLNSVTTEPITTTVTFDEDAMLDEIVGFVDAYNTLIESLDNTISEEYDYDYPPLTEAQEADMSEDEIETWNSQAKYGILEKDSTIETLLDNLRSSLYTPVDGCTLTLYEIGITTGSYDEGGKLNIDEDILTEAISNDPEEVMKLFSQQSDTYPESSARDLTAEEREVRSEESGLMWKVFDTLEDSVSTKRDLHGNKGFLLEKAGTTGDMTAKDNLLYNRITDYEDTLSDLEDYLEEKEEWYYEKYTYMETYISQMNSQLESIQSSFG